ncbi:MAG TPA: flagellar motor protein MotA, partial [Candidatus Binatia bacterium]|nr:flagellar motor protein MotA [Candidatus Binatia bacterium]
MIGFLAVIAIVVVLLHAQAVQFFLRNPPLNTLILSLLGVGIALSFRAVGSLDREVEWVERYRRNDSRFVAGKGPPLLGPLAVLLEEPGRRSSLTASVLRSVLDGVDARLDEQRETSRYLIGLLIFLGLLGTFW